MSSVMYRAWKCGACNKILAFIFPGGVLQIKYKDLYLKIVGICEYVCRGCGTKNTFDQSEITEQHIDGQA